MLINVYGPVQVNLKADFLRELMEIILALEAPIVTTGHGLICRVQKGLPSAFCRALGKSNICREPDPAALGKDRPSANLPLPSAGHSANFSRRQKISFAECRALDKDWPSAKKSLPSVGHSAKFGRRPYIRGRRRGQLAWWLDGSMCACAHACAAAIYSWPSFHVDLYT